MNKVIFSLTILFLSINYCYGQNKTYKYIGHYRLNSEIKTDTLIDKITKTKFILDSTRIFIKAVDTTGKIIWRTDAWKDNNLGEYRVKRPVIVNYDFANNERTDNKEVIWIVYNNTQFGILDKKTGKFTWLGQD